MVLVLPFLLSALIAPGLMPARALDGQMVLVICAEGGPVDMVLDPVTGEAVPLAQEDGRCDWAMALGCLMVPPDAVSVPTLTLTQTRFHPVQADTLWNPAFDPAGLHARGPPIRV